jgi:hypothetical protein
MAIGAVTSGAISTSAAMKSGTAQPAKGSGGSKPAGSKTDETTINYAAASIAELEALAAKGDAKAQNELERREAAGGADTQSANSSGRSLLDVVA